MAQIIGFHEVLSLAFRSQKHWRCHRDWQWDACGLNAKLGNRNLRKCPGLIANGKSHPYLYPFYLKLDQQPWNRQWSRQTKFVYTYPRTIIFMWHFCLGRWLATVYDCTDLVRLVGSEVILRCSWWSGWMDSSRKIRLTFLIHLVFQSPAESVDWVGLY